jgi:hypothetical protein
MRPSLMTRLALLEAADPTQAWEHTQGLSSLLAYARTFPPREPWDLPEVSDSGLGRLLKEARARQEERGVKDWSFSPVLRHGPLIRKSHFVDQSSIGVPLWPHLSCAWAQ